MTQPSSRPRALRALGPRLLTLSALLTLASLVATACGGDDGSSSTDAQGGDAAGGESGAQAGKGGKSGKGGSSSQGGDGDGPQSGGDGSGGVYAGPMQSPDECTDNQQHNGRYCAPCPACDKPGEAGRAEGTTSDGYCICKTKPGYFYAVGAEVGTFACDADGDGWVRESARLSLSANDDPVLKQNARCDLHTIDRFVLRNEAGETKSVAVSPVDLYETDRNDDDALLKYRWELLGLPGYGSTGAVVDASLINPLTKLCHTPNTDYNDNGIADVEEWAQHPKPPTLRDSQKVFIEFSYYAELETGSYVPPEDNENYGSYVIAERSRKSTAKPPEQVPMTFGSNEGSYWRLCSLRPDSTAADVLPPIGMDFAEHTPSAEFSGLNYHSLFKCLSVTTVPDPENPSQVTVGQLSNGDYRLNNCRAQGVAAEQDANPAHGSYGCKVVQPSSLHPGDVVWGAVRYIDYTEDDKYVRGCINECALPAEQCPEIAPGVFSCVYEKTDFGEKLGCAEKCDKLDNDGDGTIDNGTNGLDCPTNLQGICAKGLTKCTNGVLSCQAPQPEVERCDEIDQDCDGDPGVGSVKPIPEVGQTCQPAMGYNAEKMAYEPLQGVCAIGTLQCAIDQLTQKHRLICTSDLAGAAELPCDDADNNCDGQVDESRQTYEGSKGQDKTECSDGIDNDCNGVTDALPHPSNTCGNTADDPFATKLLNHTAELCDNGVDDDCDCDFDEHYQEVGLTVTSAACAFPCDVEGAQACSSWSVPVPVNREAVTATNLPTKWVFYPPAWNTFQKVITCNDGYWRVTEVCGLDSSTIPGTQVSWGANYNKMFCQEDSQNRTAQCTDQGNGQQACQFKDGAPSTGCVTQCYPDTNTNCPSR
jgi:Putative metal-binding motif